MKPSDSVGRARAPHPVRVGVAAAAAVGSEAAGAARAARAVRLAHSHRADGAVESVHAEVKEGLSPETCATVVTRLCRVLPGNPIREARPHVGSDRGELRRGQKSVPLPEPFRV